MCKLDTVPCFVTDSIRIFQVYVLRDIKMQRESLRLSHRASEELFIKFLLTEQFLP